MIESFDECLNLSFDGCGINNASNPYCPRLATFTQEGKAVPGLGDMLAAALEMYAALANAANVLAALAIGELKAVECDSPALAQARKALKLAEGG